MKTILIVDDEPDFVSLLQDNLESRGYRVLTAHEGVRGIETAHKSKPDLILLDIKMPAGMGQSVLQALKKHSETRKIPVIVITALANRQLKEEIKQLGAKDFFTKPFDTEMLLEKIKSLLDDLFLAQ